MVNPKKRLTAQAALEHPWLMFWERREASEAEQKAKDSPADMPKPPSGSSLAGSDTGAPGSKPRPEARHIHAHSHSGGRAANPEPAAPKSAAKDNAQVLVL